MAEHGHSSSSHPSWKGGTANKVSPLSTTYAMRIMGTLLCVISVSYLAWLLIPPFRLRTHVITIVARESDRLAVPPILYGTEDVTSLKDVGDITVRDVRFPESGNIDSLHQALTEIEWKKKDVLVVYVSAQGISQDGVPCLLYEDFDPTAKVPSRYELTELLKPIRECRATTKLLVMDCGNLVSDIRLGILVNEFSQLVQQTISTWPDPQLWVLVSHSMGQVSTPSYHERRSAFGQSVCNGLKGWADSTVAGNQDAYVTLAELSRYVWQECQMASEGIQTPYLLHAGTTDVATKSKEAEIRIVELSSETLKNIRLRLGSQDESADFIRNSSTNASPDPQKSSPPASTTFTPQSIVSPEKRQP